MGANMLDVVPPQKRDETALWLAQVRAGKRPDPWLFNSEIIPGEMRLMRAASVRNRPFWVSISVLCMPSRSSVPGEPGCRSSVGGMSFAFACAVAVELMIRAL
jgi:hypothetical protein